MLVKLYVFFTVKNAKLCDMQCVIMSVEEGGRGGGKRMWYIMEHGKKISLSLSLSSSSSSLIETVVPKWQSYPTLHSFLCLVTPLHSSLVQHFTAGTQEYAKCFVINGTVSQIGSTPLNVSYQAKGIGATSHIVSSCLLLCGVTIVFVYHDVTSRYA